MASLSSCAMRSASRLSRGALGASLQKTARATATIGARRRTYVTESKPDNARVETAIKLDKKDFAGIPPTMMQNGSEMKISPMAGMCRFCGRFPPG